MWVARDFTEEHRAALDWLNDITDERFNFFGFEVELWRIGDSAVAPKFNIISKPNDWSRSVATGATQVERGGLTDAKQLQLSFWSGFRRYVEDCGASFRTTKALPQNWMNVAIGRTGFRLCAVASMWDSEAGNYDSHELRAEFVAEGAESASQFRALLGQKEHVEEELGYELTWHSQEGVRMRRAYRRRSVDLRNEDAWPDYFEWLCKHLEDLGRVFKARVMEL